MKVKAVQLRSGGVAAQNAKARTGVAQLNQQVGMPRVFEVTFHIGKEDIFPALAAHGARLQLAHVDAVSGQQVQHA